MAAMRSCTSARYLVAGFVLAACGDNAAGPDVDAGVIVVTASTGGDRSNTDAFRLTIDDSEPFLIAPNGRIFLAGLSEGTHLLHLVGIPANCSVDGHNPLAVSLGPGERAEITFTIICVAVLSGGFNVFVITTGTALDEDGYGLSVAGADTRHIGINAMETFTGLAPGVHLVTLKDLAQGCSLVGGNPQPFTVVKDKIVRVGLQVVCGG
jgi:hypothetical protein